MSGEQDERGTLEQISLSLLLIRALDRRWTGALTITAPDGEREILEFQRGLVCRAIVPDQAARLGELLVNAKVVTATELEQALGEPGLLGAALRRESIIDETTLQRALVLQLLRRTTRIFGRPTETRWSFSSKLKLFEGMPPGVRIDTLRVLWAGLSTHGEMGTWLSLTLKRIGESPFQVRPDVNMRRYGFTGDARRVVRLIRDERLTLKRLTDRELAPPEIVKQIVYLLAITRYLDFTPVGGQSSPAPEASGVSEAVEETSIAEESTIDESSAAESPTTSDEEQGPAGTPRRVARIKLRRVAMRPAAPDPPGSGEHRPHRSSPDSSAAPSSDQRESDSRPAPSSDRFALGSSASLPSDRSPDSKTAPPSDNPFHDMAPDSTARERVRAEVESRLERLSRETPFSLLALEPSDIRGKEDADVTEVLWNAYERRSRKWHPDRCPEELGDLRSGMGKIHEAMTEAFVLLTESEERHDLIAEFTKKRGNTEPPTMRSQSVSAASEDSDTPPGSGRDVFAEALGESAESSGAPPPSSGERRTDAPELSPAELHTNALVALSEQRFDEALRLCKAACDADPDNPDFLASSVWIRASMTRPDTKVLLLDLDGVLREHPDHVQGRYYRGVLRRRLGSDNAAKRDLERVLELQPGHAGAAAQVAELAKRRSLAKKR